MPIGWIGRGGVAATRIARVIRASRASAKVAKGVKTLRPIPEELGRIGKSIEYIDCQPDFAPFSIKTVKIDYTGTRPADFRAADAAAGITSAFRKGANSEGIKYTWIAKVSVDLIPACFSIAWPTQSAMLVVSVWGGTAGPLVGLCLLLGVRAIVWE